MVPFCVTAIKNMTMNKDDGILTVYDMHSKDNLKFYGEDKYWNMDLKDEFMAQTRDLWIGNFSDKNNGSIFRTTMAVNTAEDDVMCMKVQREMAAAVVKFGEATRPSLFEDDWQARIDKRKGEIVGAL